MPSLMWPLPPSGPIFFGAIRLRQAFMNRDNTPNEPPEVQPGRAPANWARLRFPFGREWFRRHSRVLSTLGLTAFLFLNFYQGTSALVTGSIRTISKHDSRIVERQSEPGLFFFTVGLRYLPCAGVLFFVYYSHRERRKYATRAGGSRKHAKPRSGLAVGRVRSRNRSRKGRGRGKKT